MRTSKAFTLVELLVVIGIIALLISILLPVLGRAREAANQIKCAANMRSAAQAMMLYVNENDGWLAGPHTSGRKWRPSIDNIDPAEASAGTEALQNFDWASPTLGLVLDLPENDIARLQALYKTELYCPTNDKLHTDVAFGGGPGTFGNPQDFPYASYSAVAQFHVWPQRENPSNLPYYDSGQWEEPPLSNDMFGSYLGTPGKVSPPRSYSPKITKVGGGSEKVYLVEGARYVSLDYTDRANPLVAGVSLNLARYQRVGGNFMVGGPFGKWDNTPFQLNRASTADRPELTDAASNFAWRHRGMMNLAFFDGHVEARAMTESTQVGLYVPRDSIITDAASTYDWNDKDGQVVN